LESLSPPGGIAISRAVRDQVRSKLPFIFRDQGEHQVKNIAQPMKVYAVDAKDIAELSMSERPGRGGTGSGRMTAPALGALAAVLLLLFGGGAWWFEQAGREPQATSVALPSASVPPRTGVAGNPGQAAPRLSIVVLPFSNLSGSPDQDYFADGLTEDLTTDLSLIAGSFVIARNTAFTYKGRPVDVREVGRDLGVRYVLEGSVRRVGDKARVNAQLIDAETGGHLWAERFETSLGACPSCKTESRAATHDPLISSLPISRAAARSGTVPTIPPQSISRCVAWPFPTGHARARTWKWQSACSSRRSK
jgi:TolB-like protein